MNIDESNYFPPRREAAQLGVSKGDSISFGGVLRGKAP